MTAPVVSLAERRAEPNPVVVASVRKMLALAEAGELEGVLWCASRKDGRTEEEQAGVVGPLLAGALAMLQHRLCAGLFEAFPDEAPPIA